MPEPIQQTFQNLPIMLQWYAWGTVVSFLATLAATIWVFADAQRQNAQATLWKSLAAVAFVLTIPALLARLYNGFALEMRSSLHLLAYLSMAALALGVVCVVVYTIRREQPIRRCPVCGQPQQPGWLQCPYHPALQAAGPSVAPTIPQPVVPPVPHFSMPVHEPAGLTEEKETMVGQPSQMPSGSNRSRETVILTRDEKPKPLAFLAIVSGPYTSQMLPLKAGVTRIGRDGVRNDHAIDDEAVSEQHLSIRYQDGAFTLTDLDSSNGTEVNGKRVDKCVLEANDNILVGKTRLVFIRVAETGTQSGE